jgi:hypothetical protein
MRRVHFVLRASPQAAANHSNRTGRRSVHAGPPAPSERPPKFPRFRLLQVVANLQLIELIFCPPEKIDFGGLAD